MKSEHFGEGFVKGFVKAFSEGVNTVKAFALCIDTLLYMTFYTVYNSFYLIYLKSSTSLESVHSVHLSKGSVHESVHKVFTKCSLNGVNHV